MARSSGDIVRGRRILNATGWLLSMVLASSALAQDPSHGVTLDTSARQTTVWQVGMSVEADRGPCTGLFATLPVPAEWPEQKVREVRQEISPQVGRVQYRELDHGVRQMLVQIPRLASGQRADVLITYEIERYPISAPQETDDLVLAKRLPRELRIYLGNSPYIQVRHREIRALERELRDESLTAWKQIEKFYDHVRQHVQYMNGPLKGAVAALRDGSGDCEELASLFIALCRAHGVPARTVWVPDHCYAEFYLESPDGKGNWYPCQVAGTRAFGSIPELRPILQKGDNFKVPEKKERQRYVAEFLTGNSQPGGRDPKVEFIRRRVTDAPPAAGL